MCPSATRCALPPRRWQSTSCRTPCCTPWLHPVAAPRLCTRGWTPCQGGGPATGPSRLARVPARPAQPLPSPTGAVPPEGLLAAWGTAAVTGMCSLDEAADAVAARHDAAHRVAGLPREPGPVTLAYALGRLRALGAVALRLVLPRPGDPSGLPGPKDFTEAAVERAAAVVATGAGLGLIHEGRGRWTAYEVVTDATAPISLRQARRDLDAAVREAAAVLAALDVARWDPAATHVLPGRATASPLPPSADPEAHTLLAQGLRIEAVARIASASDGAALSATVMAARSRVLRDLDAAARRAIEAACSHCSPR